MRSVLEFASTVATRSPLGDPDGTPVTYNMVVLMNRERDDEPGVFAYGFGFIVWQANVMTFVNQGY